VQAQLRRTFLAEEDRPGRDRVVVLDEDQPPVRDECGRRRPQLWKPFAATEDELKRNIGDFNYACIVSLITALREE
jgi:hypothetical protein